MHELMEESISEEDVDGEICDLGVYVMKRNSIDIREQTKLIKENSEELQVDLV